MRASLPTAVGPPEFQPEQRQTPQNLAIGIVFLLTCFIILVGYVFHWYQQRVEAQEKAAAKAARRAAGGASSSDGDVMGIIDAATSAEEQRTARGLGAMRERQQAEAARAAKAGERKKLKEQKKKELLEALRAQKKERKAAAKPTPTPEPPARAAGGKKRRVSFSPGT